MKKHNSISVSVKPTRAKLSKISHAHESLSSEAPRGRGRCSGISGQPEQGDGAGMEDNELIGMLRSPHGGQPGVEQPGVEAVIVRDMVAEGSPTPRGRRVTWPRTIGKQVAICNKAEKATMSRLFPPLDATSETVIDLSADGFGMADGILGKLHTTAKRHTTRRSNDYSKDLGAAPSLEKCDGASPPSQSCFPCNGTNTCHSDDATHRRGGFVSSHQAEDAFEHTLMGIAPPSFAPRPVSLRRTSTATTALMRSLAQPGPGFAAYFLMNIVMVSFPSLSVMLLWSDMGYVEQVYGEVYEHGGFMYAFGAVSMLLVVGLYFADFFWPPHWPGQYFVLWGGDTLVGPGVFAMSIVCFLAACSFFVEDQSYIIVLWLTCSSPGLVMVLRRYSRPNEDELLILTEASPCELIQFFLTAFDADAQSFWSAACLSFLLTGLTAILSWCIWAARYQSEPRTAVGEDVSVVIHWIAPLVNGIANLAFCVTVAVRVVLAKRYETSDLNRSKAVMSQRMSNKPPTVESFLEDVGHVDPSTPDEAAQAQTEYQQMQQERHMLLLLDVFKYTCLSFFVSLVTMWLVARLVTQHEKLLRIGMCFITSWLIVYIALTFFFFRGVMVALIDWVQHFPLWQFGLRAYRSHWARGFLVAVFGPALPCVMGISMVNQLIRRARGLDTREQANERKWVLTTRISIVMDHLMTWEWVSVTEKVYLVAILLQVFSYTTVMTNVLLSWIISLLDSLHFALVLAMSVVAGLLCFMCPFIPGIPVYLFCGALIPAVAEEPEWASVVGGYPGGCVIAVCTGFVLKLCACAMQQKGFGGILGRFASVRRTVGAHTTMLRCFAGVLRHPHVTWGKTMIAVGGPDWPTSVLAGICNIPLWQMELATLPVIFLVIPCTLMGCFFVKKDTDSTLNGLYALMTIISLAISAVTNLGALIAMQNELVSNYWEHTRPLSENVDLEWLDVVDEAIKKRTPDVPFWLKVIYFSGAALQSMLVWVFWRGEVILGSPLFGEFQVTDPIDSLVVYDPSASDPLSLLQTSGLAAMTCSGFGLAGLLAYYAWFYSVTRGIRAQSMAELGCEESLWKARRHAQAKRAAALPASQVPKKPDDRWPDLDADTE